MTFSWDSPVFFDELDLNGTLHNSRFAVHVERAQSALFESLGKGWARFGDRDPDLHYVVRELHVEFLAAVTAPGPLRVELTFDRIGTTSAVYGFRCGDEVTYAKGYRVIVKTDPVTGRPSPWSDWYRETFRENQS
ncbi:acyl-CoA thioesterase [Umezawaea tangerina]|uniref:Acyl-CoA thioester hydrolase n=1 Tax=Umezawaea tangerina TaxID=84725 RepID=A0A2T0SWT9_9PSEU|nr:hotdog domain-containing protein [Umezawaea tangerina]PRY37887.1 acyl-CoA thioester hydrolase [Umezawaea tangerina]